MKMILKVLKIYIKEVFSMPKVDKRTIKVMTLIILLIGTVFVPPILVYVALYHLLNNVFLIFATTLIVALISCRGAIRTIDKLEDDIFD